MIATVSQILDQLGQTAPWSKAADWDAVGLQVGDPEAPAARVAITHEVTERIVDRLLDFDLVIAYHPLIFRPLRRLVAGGGVAGRIVRLIESRTAVAAVHTNFDVATGGTSDALAAALGLSDVSGFGSVTGQPSVKVVVFVPSDAADAVAAAMIRAGGGQIGNYGACSFRSPGLGSFIPGAGAAPVIGEVGRFEQAEEVRLEMVAPAAREPAVVAALVAAHPYEEPAFDIYDVRSNLGMVGRIGRIDSQPLDSFAGAVQSVTGGTLRVAGSGVVSRVAVVPGSGADFIEAAVGAGAEVLVTGDVGHHRARAALDAGLCIVDPGHIPTERPGVQALYAAVGEMEVASELVTAPDTDPWERS